jgi:hypothetical protein
MLANYLVDLDWLAKLAFLVNIFGNMNDLNLSLQGPRSDIFRLSDEIMTFIKKLKHWGVHFWPGMQGCVPCLTELLRAYFR